MLIEPQRRYLTRHGEVVIDAETKGKYTGHFVANPQHRYVWHVNGKCVGYVVGSGQKDWFPNFCQYDIVEPMDEFDD